VRFSGRSARRVGDEEDVVTVAEAVDDRVCKADLRPQRCEDELPSLLDGVNDALVLPRVERRAVDWFLIGENVLHRID